MHLCYYVVFAATLPYITSLCFIEVSLLILHFKKTILFQTFQPLFTNIIMSYKCNYILAHISPYYSKYFTPYVDKSTFYSVLVKRICSLIEQNEKLQTDVTGQEWAVREALNPHRLQEGGTFLNTLLKRIDLTLTDLLSYIVEFVNQYDNLGLYQDVSLQDMWLQMFGNEHICQLKYEHVKQSDSSTRHNLVQKLGTLSTKGYSCKVPFSWLILSGVEAKWKIFADTEDDTSNHSRSLY